MMVLDGSLSVGGLTALISYCGMFENASNSITHKVVEWFRNIERAGEFLDVLDRIPTVKDEGTQDFQDMSSVIEFKNVGFCYPSSPDVKIIEDISFKIPQGSSFGIVGTSGHGKSTIMKLFLRLYNRSEGDITVDGNLIEDLSLAKLHHQIGYVCQTPELFSGTIEENITYGLVDYSQEDFKEVCAVTEVSTFIEDEENFPKGY